MKLKLLLFTLAIVLLSCNHNKYTISGTAKGVPDGEVVRIGAIYLDVSPVSFVDTVRVKNGKFKFEGEISEPCEHVLQIEDAKGMYFFILEKGNIVIDINKDTLEKSKSSGTYNNDEKTKFRDEVLKLMVPINTFAKEHLKRLKSYEFPRDKMQNDHDMDTLKVLAEKYQVAQGKLSETYIKEHPKMFFSLLVIKLELEKGVIDGKKAEKLFYSLDESVRKTKTGEKMLESIKSFIKIEK